MNPHHIILLVVVPMAAGVVTLLLHGQRRVQRGLGVLFLTGNLFLALQALRTVYAGLDLPPIILVSQMGNWPAPFGISVVVDPLSALMLATSAAVCLAVFVYCIFALPARFEGGLFHPLFHLLVAGVQWSFIAGDLFNLFVAYEVMLMASYAMFVAGTTREQMRQAYKYVLLNLVASALLVTCCGLIYGQLGTLNMADLAGMAVARQVPPSAVPVIALLLVVFGGKTAIFPLWYWLPDTYHTLPAAVGGLFAGLLTKVGAYTIIRVFVMMFGACEPVASVVTPLLLVSAGITMFVGVLGAVSMTTVRRILSIHIISQVGYMILGIGLMTELAVAGAIFFIMHNMVVKTSLFLCAGLMEHHGGSDDLAKVGGLARRAPFLATMFLVAALSLAGLPPLSGFFGKWALLYAALEEKHYWLAGLALVTSLLTLLSMLKIWGLAFWSKADKSGAPSERVHERRTRGAGGAVGVAMLVVLALSMGLGAHVYFDICVVAARSVLRPHAYIEAVMGRRGVTP